MLIPLVCIQQMLGGPCEYSVDKRHVLQIWGISRLTLFIESFSCLLNVLGAGNKMVSMPAQVLDFVQVTQHTTHSLGGAYSDLTLSLMFTVENLSPFQLSGLGTMPWKGLTQGTCVHTRTCG